MVSVISACVWWGIATVSGAEQQPNVVLFLVDDMGPMDTSVPFMTDVDGKAKRYPLNDYYRTPAMARLAASGIRFSTFYAMSVCSPTRTSILTGQNAARHRVTQWIRSEENNRGEYGPPEWRWVGFQRCTGRPLPGVLQTNGYRTIFIGKAHFGPLQGNRLSGRQILVLMSMSLAARGDSPGVITGKTDTVT